MLVSAAEYFFSFSELFVVASESLLTSATLDSVVVATLLFTLLIELIACWLI